MVKICLQRTQKNGRSLSIQYSWALELPTTKCHPFLSLQTEEKSLMEQASDLQ